MLVDLSKYLSFIRHQGGDGCWGYATLAMWEILNEMQCPYSPTLSMNLWLMLHRRRELWEKQGFIFSPDGRSHKLTNPEFGFFQSFGITTEGTEPTISSGRWIGGFTDEGVNEAQNYRLKSPPLEIEISAKKFKEELALNHPIRLEAGPHVIAIVGYDETKQTFKYVDSAGDQAWQGGFSTFTFTEIDNKKVYLGTISKAYTIEIIPPKPVPVAHIWIEHETRRMNLNLWLGIEDSPLPKRKIWPAWEWGEDNSRTLRYTVRLPSELVWPPKLGNRVTLDLYDSGAIEPSGGTVKAFTVVFGGHIINGAGLPVKFKAGEHLRLFAP